jgi:hypothetical protein
MSTGIIQQSSSPFAVSVLFATKRGGALRFCIDYRDINSKTTKNRYPRPLIKYMLHLLGEARIYTKLDVGGTNTSLWVKVGDQHQ